MEERPGKTMDLLVHGAGNLLREDMETAEA